MTDRTGSYDDDRPPETAPGVAADTPVESGASSDVSLPAVRPVLSGSIPARLKPWWQSVRADPRRRRRLNGWAAVAAFAVLVGVQNSDFALIGPGPAPDLTAAVHAAQVDAEPDGAGRFLATTITARSATWFQVAGCAVAPSCQMLQVKTDAPDARALVAAQMAESKSHAATVARTLAPPAAQRDGAAARLDADLGEVGGPSAGLMLTLAYVDELTAGDLTGGMVVAGTGTVTPSGQVGPIAGISRKVQGAQLAGARVFFAPEAEAQEASGAADPGLKVVPVSSADDAVRWLCEHGGTAAGVC